MNNILVGSALTTFGIMFRNIYKYYFFKNICHSLKTSIQLDTTFETVTKELNNKKILLATSIDAYEDKKNLQNFVIYQTFNEEIDYLPFKFKKNFFKENSINLRNFESVNIDVCGRGNCLYFDSPVIKSYTIKSGDKFFKENYDKLNLIQKIRIWPIGRHDKYF